MSERTVKRGLLVCALLWVAVIAAGCASFLENLGKPAPQTGIYLGNTRIEVSLVSEETDNGTPLSEFHCGAHLMYCETFGATKECRCVRRDW